MEHLAALQRTFKRSCIAALAFVMAFTLAFCFPQTAPAAELPELGKGEVRIHVLPFDYTDAIIVECDGRFGMVDSAEDEDSPDGSDFRYPNRPGITKGWGREAEVIAYMKKIGVTQDNLDFYIGTHPHSDHIGTAAQIIHAFHPKTIYTPVYDDSYITSSANLWDNQYVYDRMLAAVAWAQSDYGARFIQHLDPNWTEPGVNPKPETPTDPDDGEGTDKPSDSGDNNADTGDPSDDPTKDETTSDSNDEGDEGNENGEGGNDPDPVNPVEPVDPDPDPNPDPNPDPDPDPVDENTGSPLFKLGSATIEIFNYDETYQTTKVHDANYFSYGVKVTAANGRSAFLAGDINNHTDGDGNGVGDEDRLAQQLGKIDFLKMGHHGIKGSNTPAYLRAILKAAQGNDHAVVVQTGAFSSMPQETVAALNQIGVKHFQAASALTRGQDAFVADLTASGVRTNADNDKTVILQTTSEAPFAYLYCGGLPYKGTGWYEDANGEPYYFGEAGSAGSSVALADCWATYNGKRIYVGGNGRMTSEWGKIDSKWYLFDAAGNMLHGWQNVHGKWYYLEDDGSMATGWKKLGSTWYYLDSANGDMKTGWFTVDNVPYFAKSSGAMVSGNGWKKLEGAWAYVTPSGALKTDWLKDGGKWYYLRDTGKMATGWAKVEGTWYYLNGSGAMKTGWQKLSGKWYYMAGSGAMKTGWQKVSGKWYYLDDSGVMKTGWADIDGDWYYLNGSGAMQTGWKKIGSNWYHLKGSGAMTTGWLKSGGKWYYLNDDGVMVTGLHRIEGTSYRFSSSGALQ